MDLAGSRAQLTGLCRKTESLTQAKLSPQLERRCCQILTVGHSTRSIEAFVAMLVGHSVTMLVDVRTVPRSRRNPQFNADTLPQQLAGSRIGYLHASGLGGFRRPRADSLNAGWRNASFRGYADYMQTAEFVQELIDLMELAQHERVALMCAEAVPWRCHRSLIADALIARAVTACEIVSPTRLRVHTLTSFARLRGTQIDYPAQPPA